MHNHVAAHLADAHTLAALGRVAHCSPWHLQRLFRAAEAETPAGHVRRVRLEAAALRLLRHPGRTALLVALEVGFGSAAAFSRAFTAHFGCTPRDWRAGAGQRQSQRGAQALQTVRRENRKANQDAARRLAEHRQRWPLGPAPFNQELAMQPTVKTLPALRLAYLRHTGPYGQPSIPATWEVFREWCERQGFTTPRRTMLGIAQDDPAVTPAERLRYDCCVQVPHDFRLAASEPLAIGVQSFAAGRFFCVPFQGHGEEMAAAWPAAIAAAQAQHSLADRPGIDLYDESFTIDENTGAFSCWLCVPITG